jgi:PAS domain S-box-containing protein
VNLCLASNHPIGLVWGPELTFLYNDECISVFGDKHPGALGRPLAEAWPEVAGDIVPLLKKVMESGKAIRFRDTFLLLERRGYREETYFDASYGPIHDELGQTRGVFAPLIETTHRVVRERRLRTLRDLASQPLGRGCVFQACRTAAEVLAANPKDVPFALFYLVDEERTRARLMATTGVETGAPAAPEEVELTESGKPWGAAIAQALREARAIQVNDLASCLPSLPAGSWGKPPNAALVLPILAHGGQRPCVVLVVGLNPYRPLDEEHQTFFGQLRSQLETVLLDVRAYESEMRYRALFESVTDTILIVDAQGRVRDTNAAATRLLGYSREELLSMRADALLVTGRQEFRKGSGVLSGPDAWQGELPLRRKDGTVVTVEGSAFPLGTAPPEFVSLLRDVRTRRQRDKALRDLNREFFLSGPSPTERTARLEVRRLNRELTSVQESTRAAVARELHDEFGQILTGLALTLSSVATSMDDRARPRLAEARSLVNELATRARWMYLELRPPLLDGSGLGSALSWYVQRYSTLTGVEVVLDASELNVEPEEETGLAVYRVIQEALTNVARHAAAGQAWVRVASTRSALRLEVADRGQGFDPRSQLGNPASAGLTGMRERVLWLDGTLDIQSAPGGGTRIVAELPLNPAA